eukprot:2971679-Rhodomonas_salina.1
MRCNTERHVNARGVNVWKGKTWQSRKSPSPPSYEQLLVKNQPAALRSQCKLKKKSKQKPRRKRREKIRLRSHTSSPSGPSPRGRRTRRRRAGTLPCGR